MSDDASASELIARDRFALDDLVGARKQCMLVLIAPPEPTDDEPGDDDEDGDDSRPDPDPAP